MTKANGVKVESTTKMVKEEASSASKKAAKSPKTKGDKSGDEKIVVNVTLKPGQTKETPPPGVADRVFYESLYKENPDSLMALQWCLSYGVLPLKDCKDALAKLKRMKAGHTNHDEKKRKTSSQTESTGTKKKKMTAATEEYYDAPELASGGTEGIGTMTM